MSKKDTDTILCKKFRINFNFKNSGINNGVKKRSRKILIYMFS